MSPVASAVRQSVPRRVTQFALYLAHSPLTGLPPRLKSMIKEQGRRLN